MQTRLVGAFVGLASLCAMVPAVAMDAAGDARTTAVQVLAARAAGLTSYDLTFQQTDGGNNSFYADSVSTTLRVRPTGYAIRIEIKPSSVDQPGIATTDVQIVGSKAMASAAVLNSALQQARIIDPVATGFEHEIPRANKCLPALLLPPIPGIPCLFDPFTAVADPATEVAWVSSSESEHAIELRWTNDHSIACRVVIDADRQGMPLVIDYGGVEIRTRTVGAVGSVPFPSLVAGAHPETWLAIDAGTVADPSWRWTVELMEPNLAGVAEPPLDPNQSAIAAVPTGYAVSDFISERVYVADGGKAVPMAVASIHRAKADPAMRPSDRSPPPVVAGGGWLSTSSWSLGLVLLVGTSLVSCGLVWRKYVAR